MSGANGIASCSRPSEERNDSYYFPDSAKNSFYAVEAMKIIGQDTRKRLTLKSLQRCLEMYGILLIDVKDFSSGPYASRVIHNIAGRSFHSDIQDSKTMGKLISYLYEVDGHFMFFFHPTVEFCPPERRMVFARFFIAHAYHERMTFDGQRLVDVKVPFRWIRGDQLLVVVDGLKIHPRCLAILWESSALLLLLMQYGTLLHLPSLNCWYCVRVILIGLLEALEAMENNQAHNQLTLRIQAALDGVNEELIRSRRIPKDLMHACRTKVRMVLHENWQLPDGVGALPIPDSIKSYINLENEF